MKKKQGLLLGFVLASILYGITSFYGLNNETQNNTSTENIQFSDSESQVQNSENESKKQNPANERETQNLHREYSFRTKELLNSHYQKHGYEFGDISKEEYLQKANALINSDNPELLIKNEKEDGDKIYYLESSNEFLVLSTDGYIRTYFKPAAGINYYNRQ